MLTSDNPGELLPDVPGWVHGIKSDHPWTVQCDDCLTCWSGDWLMEVAKQAHFNTRIDRGDLRLCTDCWAARGWTESYHGWDYTEPTHTERTETP